MKLEELLPDEEIDAAVQSGLVKFREDQFGYRIYNYTPKAQYTKGAFDGCAVRMCRGLIVDADGTIVARPWEKFFNYNQDEAGDIWKFSPYVEVTDKVDGSAGILYIDGIGRPKIATRGSFESDMALHATEVFKTKYADVCNLDATKHTTFMFEIVYPDNVIVLNYGDLDDLILLGAVNIDNGHYIGPKAAKDILNWPGPVTKVFKYKTMKEALQAPPRPNAEGLCVRFIDHNTIVKIKQEDYVRLHSVIYSTTERRIWDFMMDKVTLEEILEPLPDEMYEWVKNTHTNLMRKYNGLLIRATLDVEAILMNGGDRAEMARFAKEIGASTLVFSIMDGKDTHKQIMKMIKPKNPQQFKWVTEENQ